MRKAAAIFVVAFLIRLAVAVHLFGALPPHRMWGVNEAGGIAAAIVTARAFSTPFHDAHGPTAWLPPGYPAILAAVFEIWGVRTSASAVAAVVVNILCASFTAVLIYRLGAGLFGDLVGLVAAWAWALCPYLALIPFILWDTCLSGLLLTYGTWLALKEGHSRGGTIWCGVVWGVTGLVNPALLAAFPFVLIFLWFRDGRRWGRAAAVLGISVAVLIPWQARNFVAFHRVFFVRSNAWAEIYYGNVSFDAHPVGPTMQYQREGEIAYEDQLKRQVIEHIEEQPGKFLRDTAGRMFQFWISPQGFVVFTVPVFLLGICGLGLAARQVGYYAIPFIGTIALYPMVYYVSYIFSRYRYPIEPILYIAAAFALMEAWKAAVNWLPKVPAELNRE